MADITSLSTYLNQVTVTRVINSMNSIMAARRILRPIDSRTTTTAIRNRTLPTMPHHMVRMVGLDRIRDMVMVMITGMDMDTRVTEDWMMRRDK
ncbi:uncharacterized protein N7500_001022 [Penicillium coprophilum]|uniref:uncharacterized protein n=1 Tax=Penicillium coprophilum TaxID=36646 RepID=UPI002384F519|nr:uncharacterized protein N7500_001022 [Penicillium coprophilum]KAJ5178323.1 hypothetical protein N7500_001022 [Penicillium coprophilum]